MDTKPINPLAKHFRKPAIYLRLPSQGRFWESGLDMPENGEIPVFPMTAKDELTLRTPDALLNGQGVIDVIQSCCPNITNAWRMPSIDVDATLIAIRIASYGQTMDFDATCPHCNEQDSYGINLTEILDNIRLPDYYEKIQVDDIRIRLRPQEYFSLNATSKIRFEEQRLLLALNNEQVDELVKQSEFQSHLQRIVDLSTKVLVDSTEFIEVNDEIVTKREFIEEFYQNCGASISKAVQDRLSQLVSDGSLKPVNIKCSHCEKSYDLNITFDYANFFAIGS
jgi:hypothetical protein